MQEFNEIVLNNKLNKTTFTHSAFIALGSNLQDPILQVNNALLALEYLPQTSLIKTSSLYRTVPIGYEAQPDFVNAVAEISTDLSPLDLLDALLKLEILAGRERPFANAPRVLDCDLLLYANVKMHTEKLTLPHPRMKDRAFVLLPLSEIAPNLNLEKQGINVKLIDFIQTSAIQNQGIKKLA